jgi:tetratricopeptide (TPR) repeat protein
MPVERSIRKFFSGSLVWGCGGLAAGVGVVLLVAVGLFINRLLNLSTQPVPVTALPVVPPSPTVVLATSIPILVPRPTANAQLTPEATDASLELLEIAEQELIDGFAQEAIDLLEPEVDNFTHLDDQVRVYTCLGQSEAQLGHFQFAAVYFDKLYNLQPTVEHLYWLAMSYDLGGDLERALNEYQLLVQMTGVDTGDYHTIAEKRISDLQDVLHHTPLAPTPTARPPV